MEEAEIRDLVRRLDTASVEAKDEAWEKLRPLGEAVVPYFAEFYPKARKWEGRLRLVNYSLRYARTSEASFQLGLAACTDRSSHVRYRACMLLAYSLRPDAIPILESLKGHPDRETGFDAAAAIDAIQCKNHNFFVDRCHAGNRFFDL
jgi:hypothetical protein